MREQVERLRDAACARKVAFAEVRFAAVKSSSLMLQDGRADRAGTSDRAGVGIRVLWEGAWGFAATESTRYSDWRRSLEAAIDMAKVSRTRQPEPVGLAEAPVVVDEVQAQFVIDPAQVPLARKLAAVRGYEEAAGCYAHACLANLCTGYRDMRHLEIVGNTRGTLVSSDTVRTMVWHVTTTQDGAVRQQARETCARQGGFELIEATPAAALSVKAAARACSLLRARPAPAGSFPAVFHPSITGLLVHEAVGHHAEADAVLAGQSIFAGRLGTRIAAECITILDDTTVPGSWGSYHYDSEGVAGGRRVLVERGVLTGFLHSLETAARLGATPNGAARAEGFMHRPLVRMSNTIIQPGEQSLEELIRDIDLGMLLRGGQWGYVWCDKGQYTCHAGEGVMIRHGQLAEQVRDVAVSGLTLETLVDVLGVSRDFEIDMPGNCGKEGQLIQTNGGGPYVKVKEIVVGGQA